MRTPLFYHEKEQIIRLIVASALLRAAIKQLRIDGHPANETIGLLEEALASAEGRNFPKPLGAR